VRINVRVVSMIALLTLTAAATPARAEKVRIGYWNSGISLGFGAVMQAEKFAEKEGLEVEWLEFPDVNAPTKAIAANAIDFAIGASANGAMSIASDGIPVQIMLASQVAQLSFVVLADSPIRTMADLKGRKIGMSPSGSATAAITSAILETNFKFKAADYTAVPGTEPRLAQFLVQKDIDAACIRSVTIAQMEGAKLRYLASVPEEWAKLVGSKAPPVLAVSLVRSDWLAKNPDGAAKLVVAMRKTYEFGKTNKPAVALVLMKAANMPADAAKQYADLWDGIYTIGMEPSDVASMKKQFEIFKSVGAVKGELPANAFTTAPYEKSKTIK
jgi:ABC-type nitrate/sulfonate/bicarbonate transport system substrate-binding protein